MNANKAWSIIAKANGVASSTFGNVNRYLRELAIALGVSNPRGATPEIIRLIARARAVSEQRSENLAVRNIMEGLVADLTKRGTTPFILEKSANNLAILPIPSDNLLRNLDASQGVIGTPATTIPDALNSANNGVATVAGNYVASGQGIKTAVRFSGGQYYTFPTISGTAYSLFFVVKVPRSGLTVIAGNGSSYIALNPWGLVCNTVSSGPQINDRWVVLSLVRNGATQTVRWNEDATTAGGASATAFNWFNLGGFSAASFPISLDFGQALYYSATLDPTTAAAVRAALYSRWNISPFGTKEIVCDGNSLCFGTGSTSNHDYPSVLRTALGGDFLVHNLGVGGKAFANLLADAASKDPYITWRPTGRKYYVVNEGVNSMYSGASTASIIADMKSLCAGRRSAGAYVILQTVTKSTYQDQTGNREADRLTINAEIRNATNLGVYWDAVADTAADARLLNNLDATYYTDGTHMTDAGYAIMASVVEAVIRANEGI